MPERREIKKIAVSRPQDHNLPFSTWSLSKLAEFLVAEGVVDDISHDGLRVLHLYDVAGVPPTTATMVSDTSWPPTT